MRREDVVGVQDFEMSASDLAGMAGVQRWHPRLTQQLGDGGGVDGWIEGCHAARTPCGASCCAVGAIVYSKDSSTVRVRKRQQALSDRDRLRFTHNRLCW